MKRIATVYSMGFLLLAAFAAQAPVLAQIPDNAVRKLVNKNSGKALAIDWGSINEGAKAIQWQDCGQPDIYWRLVPAGGGDYLLKNERSGLALSVLGTSRTRGTPLVQSDPSTIASARAWMLWRPQPAGNGFYRFANRATGHFIAVAGASGNDGADIVQWNDVGQNDILWRLSPTPISAPLLADAPLVPNPVLELSSSFPRLVKLYGWRHEGRGDHYTTSDPRWQGDPGDLREGYRLWRIEGKVYSPDAPQPPGTIALYNFWNAELRDNFITSDPEWIREAPRGYHRGRLEGYAYRSAKANTTPLLSYRSGLWDNYATTSPLLMGAVEQQVAFLDGRIIPYYRFRTEGYILPADPLEERDSFELAAALEKIDFGRLRPQPPAGEALEDTPVRTPLIVMGQAFEGLPFEASDLARYRTLVSGPATPNLNRYISTASNGLYGWSPVSFAGVVTESLPLSTIQTDERAYIYMSAGNPERYLAETDRSVDVFNLDGDGRASLEEVHSSTRQLLHLDRLGVDFSGYDANRDGRVGTHELQILRFGADNTVGGTAMPTMEVLLDGVRVQTEVLLVGAKTEIQGVAHELMHTWGGVDVYGPSGKHNFRASLMASMLGDPSADMRDSRFIHPDPWHAVQWGWTRPRFFPIGPGPWRGPQQVKLVAPSSSDRDEHDARPLLLYDPERGLSEFFLVQFRSPDPTCPGSGLVENACPNHSDNGAADRGVAIWHVRLSEGGDPVVVTKEQDADGRFEWFDREEAQSARWDSIVTSPEGLLGLNACKRVTFWRKEHGPVELRWADGESSGTRLRAGRDSPTNVYVEWASNFFRPRIDRIHEGFRLRPGRTLTLSGVFGVLEEMRAVALIGARSGRRVGFRTLDLVSWSEERIQFSVPADVPAGRYELVVGDLTALRLGRTDQVSAPWHVEILER